MHYITNINIHTNQSNKLSIFHAYFFLTLFVWHFLWSLVLFLLGVYYHKNLDLGSFAMYSSHTHTHTNLLHHIRPLKPTDIKSINHPLKRNVALILDKCKFYDFLLIWHHILDLVIGALLSFSKESVMIMNLWLYCIHSKTQVGSAILIDIISRVRTFRQKN